MSLLFIPASADLVRASFAASATSTSGKSSIEDIRAGIRSALGTVRRAYSGGEDALREFLIARDAEPPRQWAARQKHANNIPVVRRAVDAHARLMYAEAPSRSWWVGEKPMSFSDKLTAETTPQEDARTEAVAQWYTDVLEANYYNDLMSRHVARAFVRDGMAAMKIVPHFDMDDVTDGVTFGPMPIEDAWPILNPDNPREAVAVIETRMIEGEPFYRLWTADEWYWVDADLDPCRAPKGQMDGDDNPLGRPPFAFMGDRPDAGFLNDVAGYQRAAINGYSAANVVMRTQGFAVPVMKGNEAQGPGTNDRVNPNTGERGVPLSTEFLIRMEQDGDFYFASNSADPGALYGIADDIAAAGYQAAELPEALLLGGDVSNVQPTTLAIAWMPTMHTRSENLGAALQYEDDSILLLARIAQAYREPFNLPEFDVPERPHQGGERLLDWEVSFPSSAIPADESAAEERSRIQVQQGFKLLEDHLKQFVYTDDTMEEISRKAAAIKAQRSGQFSPLDEPEPPELPEI